VMHSFRRSEIAHWLHSKALLAHDPDCCYATSTAAAISVSVREPSRDKGNASNDWIGKITTKRVPVL
jgi:hypothetical protein